MNRKGQSKHGDGRGGGHNPRKLSRNKKRIVALQMGTVGAFVFVIWRIGYVQQVFGPRLLAQANKVQQVHKTVIAPRGAILDAAGQKLAYDVPAYVMDIQLSAFSDKNQLAQVLEQDLGLDAARVTPLLTSNAKWIQWPNSVLEPTKSAIEQSFQAMNHSMDVTFTPTEQRFYPFGSFAANTVGFVADGSGKTGIEEEYNTQLSGQNGEVVYRQDASGFPLPGSIQVEKPAVAGDSVELTIDPTIQSYVENEMNGIVSEYHPEHAAMIVMNPDTGAILAMASRPTFNPNQYNTASATALFDNWAVNSAFEPGSTFKVIVLAAALATHTISLNQTVQSGHINIAGRTIYDWNYVGWGTITFAQALEYSSNVGFATIATRLGWSNLLHYMQLFGFMHKTGVNLPSEASSILFPPSSQGPVQLATSGFGQGISVTPLQQMQAYAAIANGGTLYRPYITKAILSPNGKIIQQFSPDPEETNILPPDVIAQVNHTAELDVSKGIDNVAAIPGYDVAGKTGTAQIADPKTGKYYANRFVVSFMGYAPGWDPKFLVYCTVYYPKTPQANTWGSTIATPPAKKVLEESLQYAHIQPQGNANSLTESNALTHVPKTQYIQMPSVIGLSQPAAAKILQQNGLQADWLGNRGIIKNQWPLPGVEVPKTSKAYLWLPNQTGNQDVMPDLTGLSMREAGDMLAALGLQLEAIGTGFANAQSIPAGQIVLPHSRVTVQFGPPSGLVSG